MYKFIYIFQTPAVLIHLLFMGFISQSDCLALLRHPLHRFFTGWYIGNRGLAFREYVAETEWVIRRLNKHHDLVLAAQILAYLDQLIGKQSTIVILQHIQILSKKLDKISTRSDWLNFKTALEYRASANEEVLTAAQDLKNPDPSEKAKDAMRTIFNNYRSEVFDSDPLSFLLGLQLTLRQKIS